MSLKSTKNAIWYLPLIILSLFGCHSKLSPKKNAATIIYPAPPDTARLQYLVSFSNSLDITGKQTSLEESVLGEDKGKPIGKPYGIATVKGKIFICDASIRGLDIIDLDKKDFYQFTPAGIGQLKLPINCSVMDDRLFITDVVRSEVVIYNNQFNYVGSLSTKDIDGKFRPMDICSSDDKIWIINPIAHQIVEFNKNRETVASIKTDEKVFETKEYSIGYSRSFPDTVAGTDEYLYNPLNIAYRNGKIYVTDFGDFRVKVFNEQGEYLYSIGEMGTSFGKFTRPKGIAVDKEQNLYVVDAGFENVQMFNGEGKFLMHFGGPYKGPGDMWLPAKVHIDYENIDYFKKYVSPEYHLKYLVFVTNQYGPDKVSVYGAIEK